MGTAGCGKTLLTKSYSDWLKVNEFKAAIVDLDPGVRTPPYTPDFDVREIFTLEDLMVKYNLELNSAFIKLSELLLDHLDLILKLEPFTGNFDYSGYTQSNGDLLSLEE